MPTTRWVGIDEAGYGPNLGPLVMSAVVAEGAGDSSPDVWADLAATVCRAGGPADRLWVDDSKAVYKGGLGRDRLETACCALLDALGSPPPTTLGTLLDALGAGSLADAELIPWLAGGPDPPFPTSATRPVWDALRLCRPLAGAPWRVAKVRAVVVGPGAFNAGLARGNKARAHFEAFASLLRWVWDCAADGVPTVVNADKHGGRHFYRGPLLDTFPDAQVEGGPEGPALSLYTVRQGDRHLTVSFRPRADAADGLVALASLVSKAVREAWMEHFNAFWAREFPGLRATAGYPLDAARFRAAIGARAARLGFATHSWWRER